MHTDVAFVLEPSSFEVKIAVEKLKKYKSPAVHQMLAEMIQAGIDTLCSEVHRHINCI
jgi:hypothetical protein